ncbi:MAG: phage tail protein, partial [Muribaculaceae bacterium]|nr:phage tail protein [Muribaculaceae bacterium]
MSKQIVIYDPSGKEIMKHPLSAGCSRKFSLMNEDSITLRFHTREAMQFPVGTSAGDFFITQEQLGKWNESTGVWEYELKFDAYYWLWANRILRYVIPGIDSARETSFSLTSTIDLHAQVILNCLNFLGISYDGSPFHVDTDDTVSGEAKLVRYENLSVLGGIQAIADAFECEWWVTGNAIHFGRCENSGSKHVFEAGINTSSISFQQSKSEAPNRLYVYGSTRNLPPNYRKVDGNDTIGGVVARRLMLPEGTPYLQTEPDIPENQIVEQVAVLDDVYPRTDLTISEEPEVYTSQGTDESGEATVEKFYRLRYDAGFLFSESYVLPDVELHIIFQSGLLNGMEFGAKFNPKGLNEKNTDGSWNPDAQMLEVVANEDYGRRLPDDVLKPQQGDKFILTGWDATKMAELGLIADAEEELLNEGRKALEEYSKDLSTCTCPMAWDYMKPLFAKGTEPKPGDVVTIIDTAHFGDGGRKSRIIGYEYKLERPYAECTYTCGENVSVKRLDSIEKKIEGLARSGTKMQVQNSLDFLSKRYSDRTPYKLSSDIGFEAGNYMAGVSGGMLGMDSDGDSFAEIARLYVRVKAFFEELTVVKSNVLAGKQYLTPGGGIKCVKVEEGNSVYKCYFLSEQDGEKSYAKFIANDLAICEQFNVEPGTST